MKANEVVNLIIKAVENDATNQLGKKLEEATIQAYLENRKDEYTSELAEELTNLYENGQRPVGQKSLIEVTWDYAEYALGIYPDEGIEEEYTVTMIKEKLFRDLGIKLYA